ncbi:MAG TPA: hypothetical protein PKD72_09320, partial [Gemmatales bacterium]|nr:hypothetical protein [Gemmatales bacterium]
MEHTESEWPNTERPDPVTEPPAQTIPSDLTFETQPFQPDGGFGIGGMLALLLILGAAAVGIGALAYYISQFFYFIFLFPFLMGLVLGAVAVALVKIGKIRA